MISQNTPSQLSRRNWLRDAAITATSAVVLPSLFTGCSDHRIPPGTGLGGPMNPPITDAELANAAKNLSNMNAWVENVYLYTGKYEQYVFDMLKSGEKPTEWKDFLVNILTEIATGILEAAAEAVPGLGPLIGAALGIASENIKQWALGDRPPTLAAAFLEFEHGHEQMQLHISEMLRHLSDDKENYKNLREGWKDLDFNGKKYTLKDLANSQFPGDANGDDFNALRKAAYDNFRKDIWNVMFIKAGTMTYSARWGIWWSEEGPTRYARDTHYRDDRYKSTYLRGYFSWFNGSFYFRYWYFMFDGRELSPAAATELFKDDTPLNIINPDGLFTRDFVFEQFHREKPDFSGYHELRKDVDKNPYISADDGTAFDPAADSFVFTGGGFPQLIKK